MAKSTFVVLRLLLAGVLRSGVIDATGTFFLVSTPMELEIVSGILCNGFLRICQNSNNSLPAQVL